MTVPLPEESCPAEEDFGGWGTPADPISRPVPLETFPAKGTCFSSLLFLTDPHPNPSTLPPPKLSLRKTSHRYDTVEDVVSYLVYSRAGEAHGRFCVELVSFTKFVPGNICSI